MLSIPLSDNLAVRLAMYFAFCQKKSGMTRLTVAVPLYPAVASAHSILSPVVLWGVNRRLLLVRPGEAGLPDAQLPRDDLRMLESESRIYTLQFGVRDLIFYYE